MGRHTIAVIVACVSVVAAAPAARTPRLPLGLDLYRPAPDDNPPTPARVALGRRLFRDRALSRDGSMSCASCHDPRRAFSDSRRLAIGIGGARLDRNAPAILNRAWGAAFFWDGRAPTLEQQVLQPILNTQELGMSSQAVVALVRSPRYRSIFRGAFGADPTLDHVARALASYVRSIVDGDSPFDRYEAGDRRALNASAVRGLAVFRGKGGCRGCHNGPTFTDEQFHNTGIAWRTGATSLAAEAAAPSASAVKVADEGRARVTGKTEDRGAFKTPTLREVARTSPYMHDGSLATLADVIDYYDRGGQPNSTLDFRLRPLHLSFAEKRDIEAFLRSLSGRIVEGE